MRSASACGNRLSSPASRQVKGLKATAARQSRRPKLVVANCDGRLRRNQIGPGVPIGVRRFIELRHRSRLAQQSRVRSKMHEALLGSLARPTCANSLGGSWRTRSKPCPANPMREVCVAGSEVVSIASIGTAAVDAGSTLRACDKRSACERAGSTASSRGRSSRARGCGAPCSSRLQSSA